jgi:hypothetical protein
VSGQRAPVDEATGDPACDVADEDADGSTEDPRQGGVKAAAHGEADECSDQDDDQPQDLDEDHWTEA